MFEFRLAGRRESSSELTLLWLSIATDYLFLFRSTTFARPKISRSTKLVSNQSRKLLTSDESTARASSQGRDCSILKRSAWLSHSSIGLSSLLLIKFPYASIIGPPRLASLLNRQQTKCECFVRKFLFYLHFHFSARSFTLWLTLNVFHWKKKQQTKRRDRLPSCEFRFWKRRCSIAASTHDGNVFIIRYKFSRFTSRVKLTR